MLIRGLDELGVPVREQHRAVWERRRHKVGLGPVAAAGLALRFSGAWASIARDRPGRSRPRAVVAGYLAQPDAPPAWLVARRCRAPLVVDLMISLWDTLAGDRGRSSGIAASVLKGMDRMAVRCADLVLVDTQANAAFAVSALGARPERVAVVPVGADPTLFPPVPCPEGPARAVFYGKLSPLHGLDTIVAAVRRPGVPPLRLIGDGQLGPWLDAELSRDPPRGVERVTWVPYDGLGAEIAAATVVLGVFGTSGKAARVVPNKVWQAMAVGRAIVTAAGPATCDVLTDGVDALLVPPADPDALAAALSRLAADDALCRRLGAAAHRRFLEVGAPRAVAVRFLEALDRVAPSTLPG